MAKLDGTGPRGQGPRTGRGLGNCVPKGRKLDGTGPMGQGPRTGRGLGNCDPKK